MKKTFIIIPALLCLMLSSCGTDSEQTEQVSEPVVTEITINIQEKAKEIPDVERISNAACCTPQTNAEPAAVENNAPDCCSSELPQAGGCCGE